MAGPRASIVVACGEHMNLWTCREESNSALGATLGPLASLLDRRDGRIHPVSERAHAGRNQKRRFTSALRAAAGAPGIMAASGSPIPLSRPDLADRCSNRRPMGQDLSSCRVERQAGSRHRRPSRGDGNPSQPYARHQKQLGRFRLQCCDAESVVVQSTCQRHMLFPERRTCSAHRRNTGGKTAGATATAALSFFVAPAVLPPVLCGPRSTASAPPILRALRDGKSMRQQP